MKTNACFERFYYILCIYWIQLRLLATIAYELTHTQYVHVQILFCLLDKYCMQYTSIYLCSQSSYHGIGNWPFLWCFESECRRTSFNTTTVENIIWTLFHIVIHGFFPNTWNNVHLLIDNVEITLVFEENSIRL